MSALRPVALWTLQVPAADEMIPAVPNITTTFRITMAALDPTAKPRDAHEPKRATLKILRRFIGNILDDEAEEGSEDEDEESGEEGETAKKGKKLSMKSAKIKQLKAAADAEMEIDGNAKKKGKNAQESNDDEDESEDDEDDDEFGLEEFVLCTLDTEKNYQQPLDITIGEDEEVYFKVIGNFDVFLTGNYVAPGDDHSHNHRKEYSDDFEKYYDLSPDRDELLYGSVDSEEDELDDIPNPRITEIHSNEEDETEVKKGKKADKKAVKKNLKRLAEEVEATTNGDAEKKLSKKQLKKMKANDGKAVDTTTETPEKKGKESKKVQFAQNLEQGPTPSPSADKKVEKSAEKPADKKSAEKPADKKSDKKSAKVVVDGVTIEDKKIGSGPPAKNGSKLNMRYIGKLVNGKIFDSNTKGKAFAFQLGKGEVIKGWEIGLQGMQVGGERRLTIPASAAYGKQNLPGIPPNSTLVFDVKLLEIK